jgi:hypothetical protein
MANLIDTLRAMWGHKAPLVAEEYRAIVKHNDLFITDIAAYCNATAHIQGATEFDRGVEEGKRRVWLHIARMGGLEHTDFIPIGNGDRVPRN